MSTVTDLRMIRDPPRIPRIQQETWLGGHARTSGSTVYQTRTTLHTYTFSVTRSGRLVASAALTMQGTDSSQEFTVYLAIFDPAGTKIAETSMYRLTGSGEHAFTLDVDVTVTTTGTYTARIDYVSNTGGYTFYHTCCAVYVAVMG